MKAMYLPEEQAFLRYIEIPGDGPPLLWLHGWQCSSTGELMPVAVQPPLRGRGSLLVDFLGHGYSDKPLDFAYTREAHARTIVALIDGLGLSECGIVGHSMGGAVAVLVAAARPAVVSVLVLAEASVDPGISVSLSGQTEDRFVELGFAELLGHQAREAHQKPGGIQGGPPGDDPAHRAARDLPRGLVPRARHGPERSAPSSRDLRMPRWYLIGGRATPSPSSSGTSVPWESGGR